MPLQTYIARPVEVDALKLSRSTRDEIIALLGPLFVRKSWDPINVHFLARHNEVMLREGDWLVKEPNGDGYYPCDDETFHRKYWKGGEQHAVQVAEAAQVPPREGAGNGGTLGARSQEARDSASAAQPPQAKQGKVKL